MPPSVLGRAWLRWSAVVAWMALIFFLSGQSTLPDLTGGWPEIQDIVGHFAAYGVLALLWRWALAGAGVRRAGLWAFVAAVLYGISDEFHQSFVPGRHPDLFDILTDAAGAAVTLAVERWRVHRAFAVFLPSVVSSGPEQRADKEPHA